MKTKKEAKCVICERTLRKSPTKRWWIKLRYKKGVCYECILSLADTVLKMMEKEIKP